MVIDQRKPGEPMTLLSDEQFIKLYPVMIKKFEVAEDNNDFSTQVLFLKINDNFVVATVMSYDGGPPLMVLQAEFETKKECIDWLEDNFETQPTKI